tara:strand:+ start:164 stop:742 length:579 start_codon:yes stop_codon:yes gene_type:complete
MIELYSYFIENIYQFLGVVFSIIYVIFSIKQNVLCWLALFIASLLNMAAYNLINLPLQVSMQLFFIGTAFYGWYKWTYAKNNKALRVSKWTKKQHIFWILTGFIITLLLSVILQHFDISSYPFLDSLMFTFNLIPMYMTGKKIIESWIYFIAIDVISGVFYLNSGEYFFSFLFFCYIGFATYGFLTWKKDLV